MNIQNCFKSEKPEILFVTSTKNTVTMYFKDGEDYLEIRVVTKRFFSKAALSARYDYDVTKNVNNVLEGAVATIPGLGENIDVSV